MRFFLAGNNTAINAKLLDVLRAAGHDCLLAPLAPLAQALNQLAMSDAEMVVVVLSPSPEPALALLRETRSPQVQRILAVGPVADPKLRLAALREGADQFLDESQLELELEAILRRVNTLAATPSDCGQLIS